MKKALFALAFLCEISSGMNPRDSYRIITDQHEKYGRLYDQWRDEFSGDSERMGTPEARALEKKRDAAKPEEFDSTILDAVIRQDIGSDDAALQAWQLFFDCKLHELIDFYLEVSAKMSPINAERFKEILLLLAPIINVQSTLDKDMVFTSMEKYQGYIDKIVSIWGGDPNVITFNVIQYPQFCFEMFLMQALKLEDAGNGILFQAVRCMVGEFSASQYDWDGKEGEIALYGNSMGCYEDCGGRCSPEDVWPNWYKNDLSDYGVTVSTINDRLGGCPERIDANS